MSIRCTHPCCWPRLGGAEQLWRARGASLEAMVTKAPSRVVRCALEVNLIARDSPRAGVTPFDANV